MAHGCMVYTERAVTAAVSCGTNHASAVSTPLRWIFKREREYTLTCSRRNKHTFVYVSKHIVNLTPPPPRRFIRYTNRITGMYMYTKTFILPKMSWTGTLILHRHRNDCIETPAYFLCNVSFTHTFTPPTPLQAIHSDITVPVGWA